MTSSISNTALKQITSHHRSLGLKFWFKGLSYERCAELPWVIEYLRPRFGEQLEYLDIGTGESPFPSFLSIHSDWKITCLDKCSWVQKQKLFCEKSAGRPISILQEDLLDSSLPEESFDVITCISVIEHFAGNSDSKAIKKLGRLLRPQGKLVLTTPMNDRFFTEFFLKREVYGEQYSKEPVFYQRHYDLKSVAERLIQPSGLLERQRVYFGDYQFQCFENLLQQPKPIKAFYAWRTPQLAQQFLSYESRPVSRKGMRMNTASGVILVLEKQAESH